MQLKVITSAANEHYKHWKKLNESARACRKAGATLAEGIHLAQVILEHGAPVRAVLIRENSATAEALALAGEIVRSTGAAAYELGAALYDAVSPVERGVGITLEVQIASPERPASPIACDALYLDGVQDTGNAGTLIRTAVASGVRAIAASPSSACLWSPKVLRAGMGAHFGAVIYENVEPEDLRNLFAARRLAADARGGMDLFRSCGWEAGCTVWMMGAEGPGLSDRALQAADARYLIPIEEACESLNVGAAAAVCLFEQRRRRLMAGQERR